MILKFGLLFKIDEVTKLAESWLDEHIGDMSQPNKKQRTARGRPSNKQKIDKNVSSFIKVLNIGLEIKKFCPDYEGVFEICSQEYWNIPDSCIKFLFEEFTDLCSKNFLEFLFRDSRSWKRSLIYLQTVPKSNENVEIILQKIENLMEGNFFSISNVSTELVSFLESLEKINLALDVTRKVSKVYLKFLKAKTSEENCYISEKTWRSCKDVKELFQFRRAHVSITEYMYIEMIIDWLRYNDNYKKLETSDKMFLKNSIHIAFMSAEYMEVNEGVFKKLGISVLCR